MHRRLPDPVVLPSPHSRRDQATQHASAQERSEVSSISNTDNRHNVHYVGDDDYDLDMGLIGVTPV